MSQVWTHQKVIDACRLTHKLLCKSRPNPLAFGRGLCPVLDFQRLELIRVWLQHRQTARCLQQEFLSRDSRVVRDGISRCGVEVPRSGVAAVGGCGERGGDQTRQEGAVRPLRVTLVRFQPFLQLQNQTVVVLPHNVQYLQ